MTKHIFPFLAAFLVGCVAALAARSAWHKPHEARPDEPVTPAYAQMVTNTLSPAEHDHAASSVPAAAETQGAPVDDAHAGHAQEPAGAQATVNNVCAICGMDVDASIQPATYKGKLVGFGCRMCPPMFARDPERYGPSALENKVAAD